MIGRDVAHPQHEPLDTRRIVGACLTRLAIGAGMAPLAWWPMHMTCFLHAVGWPSHSIN